MNYGDLLRDPRWQRVRLENLQRANWQCQRCLAQDKTLHVHHKFYLKGRAPWEYDGNQLLVLCDDCHKAEHKFIDALVSSLSRAWAHPNEMRVLLEGFNYETPDSESLLQAYRLACGDGSHSVSDEQLRVFGLSARSLMALPKGRVESVLQYIDEQLAAEFSGAAHEDAPE